MVALSLNQVDSYFDDLVTTWWNQNAGTFYINYSFLIAKKKTTDMTDRAMRHMVDKTPNKDIIWLKPGDH